MRMPTNSIAMKGNRLLTIAYGSLRHSIFNFVFVARSVVEFASIGDMKNALETLNDTELNGRRIRLIEDKPKSGRGGRKGGRSKSGSRSRSRSPQRKSSK